MNLKHLINPFSKFDEKTLLIIGIMGAFLNYIFCNLFGYIMDGNLHFRFLREEESNITILLYILINIILLAISLFIVGKFINSKTRIIDIINTVLIASIPSTLLLAISEIPPFKRSMDTVQEIALTNPESLNSLDLIIILIFSFISIIFLIYSFVLIYKGFKTATNVKNILPKISIFVITITLNIITQFYLLK